MINWILHEARPYDGNDAYVSLDHWPEKVIELDPVYEDEDDSDDLDDVIFSDESAEHRQARTLGYE